VRRPKRLI